MGKRLTDGQRDLIMAMLEDFSNETQVLELISIQNTLTEIYNRGSYRDDETQNLNDIREIWKRVIYDKGNSCWEYLTKGPFQTN
jgi:hypothetical protein